MAVVMGHGGDGGDEPPHPFGGGFGDDQNDVVPPKRRGMAVNKKMHKLYKANGEQPLKIVFDVNTNMPIGEVYECFIREVGSYMWRDIGFDKDTWTERWFDFDAITNHPMVSTYWVSLNNRICARYRGHKNIAKNRFDDFAGNVEAARAQAPRGMDQQRWNDVDVNAFLQNPGFVTAIGDINRFFKNQVNEENNDGEDGEEDEDN
ncbi:unnamed protein product [Lactuca saligna]|uniref:Uncharacterized protein n=1 Tax=Lactuca saligna TaxID=75948 RepID=A0AA36EF21_LACSI|nr:unnamed protein product [Lactuca saligna]